MRTAVRRWSATKNGSVIAWIAPLAAGSGCSLVLDDARQQCESTADCQALFGAGIPFACEANLCVRPVCTDDASCRVRGAAFATSVCESDGLCHPGCTADTQCMAGQVCDVSTNHCKTRCTQNADCQASGLFATCASGFCSNEAWSCIGQPDERPRPAEATGTLKVRIVSVLGGMAPLPSLRSLRACPMPMLTQDCPTPLAGSATSYDANTGEITVTGLQQGAPFRLMIEPPPELQLMPIDFYSQRLVRDLTVLETPIQALPLAIAETGTALLMKPIDLAKGSVMANVFDCKGGPGVGVKVSKQGEGLIAYLGEDGLPDPAEQSVNRFGVFILLNMTPSVSTTVSLDLGTTQLGEYRILPIPNRLTVWYFWPRDYTR